MTRLLMMWLCASLALGAAAIVLPGVRISNPTSLVVGAAALGLINVTVRPVLRWLTWPITWMTLGLSYYVINGVAFALAAYLIPGFRVDSCSAAMLAPFIIGTASWLLSGRSTPRASSK